MTNPQDLLGQLRAVESYGYTQDETCTNWYRNPDGPAAADHIESLTRELAEAREKTDHLMHIIDRDRYVVAHGVVATENEIRSREWLLTGRGPYEWDDDDYRKEFGAALEAIRGAIDPLRKVGWDKSDCTRIEERVNAARDAASELLKQPIGNREMVAADLLGNHFEVRATTAEAQCARLREALTQIDAEVSNGINGHWLNALKAIRACVRAALGEGGAK